MVISHSIVHAALARQHSPTTALAGFAVAFSVSIMLSSTTGPMALITISHLKDRRSLAQLLRFTLLLTFSTGGIAVLIAETPLNHLVFSRLLGASPEVAEQARWALLTLACVKPISGCRNLCMGLLMHFRRTHLITVGTLVRISMLTGAAILLSNRVEGAVAGSLILVTGISSETLYIAIVSLWFSRRLPAMQGRTPGLGELWRFGWPLMVNHSAEGSLPLIINFFLGRLANPDLALATFGVVRGLVWLLTSPLRNLAQTTQALVKHREDLAVIFRFTLHSVLAFTVLVLILFYTPLRGLLLRDVMGLSDELARACVPGLLVALTVPVFFGYAAVLRGLMGVARQTRVLALTAIGRFAMVIGVVSLTLFLPGVNGAMMGVAALASAYLLETSWLSWLVVKWRRQPHFIPTWRPREAG